MPNQPRTRPTDDQLRAGSIHLLYEIEMFCALADSFESGAVDLAVSGLPGLEMPVRNAVVESFAIHTRGLISFLSPPRAKVEPWEDDVFAKDYVDDWTFDTHRWKAERVRVNQHVAHLTLARTKRRADSTFPTRQIRRDLGAELQRFRGRLDADAPVTHDFRLRARRALHVPEIDLSSPRVDVLAPPRRSSFTCRGRASRSRRSSSSPST
jgi:hypothetical protein